MVYKHTKHTKINKHFHTKHGTRTHAYTHTHMQDHMHTMPIKRTRTHACSHTHMAEILSTATDIDAKK